MAAGRHAAAAAGPALVSSLLNPHLEMLMKKKTKKNVVFLLKNRRRKTARQRNVAPRWRRFLAHERLWFEDVRCLR